MTDPHYTNLASEAREEVRREERERIAEMLEREAEAYRARSRQPDSLHVWRHYVVVLEHAAREIRDGAHETKENA